jgi:hypothetical protein
MKNDINIKLYIEIYPDYKIVLDELLNEFLKNATINDIFRFFTINNYYYLKKVEDEINQNILTKIIEKLNDNELIEFITSDEILNNITKQKSFFIEEDEIETNFLRYIVDKIEGFEKKLIYNYLVKADDELIKKILMTYETFMQKIKKFDTSNEIKLLYSYISNIEHYYYEKRNELYIFLFNNGLVKSMMQYLPIQDLMAFLRTYFHVDEKLIDKIIIKYCDILSERFGKIFINGTDKLDNEIAIKLFKCLIENNKISELKKIIENIKNVFEEDEFVIIKDIIDDCKRMNENNYKEYEKIFDKYNINNAKCLDDLKAIKLVNELFNI